MATAAIEGECAGDGDDRRNIRVERRPEELQRRLPRGVALKTEARSQLAEAGVNPTALAVGADLPPAPEKLPLRWNRQAVVSEEHPQAGEPASAVTPSRRVALVREAVRLPGAT